MLFCDPSMVRLLWVRGSGPCNAALTDGRMTFTWNPTRRGDNRHNRKHVSTTDRKITKLLDFYYPLEWYSIQYLPRIGWRPIL